MQQWICHIQGLENIFGAREVEKIGRQIDGVEDLSVDFAGETLVLKANSNDVLKRLEKTLALSGYKLLKKGYFVASVVHVPDLESNDVQEVVRKTIGSHSQVRKLDIRPLSKLVSITHDIDFSITAFICDLNNQQVTAHLRNQSYLKNRWQTFAHFSVLFASMLFFAGVLIENFHQSSMGTLACFISSLVITGILLAKRAVTQLALHRKLTYGFLMLVVTLISMSQNLWFEASLLGLSLAVSFMFEERAGWKLKQQWSYLKSMLPLFAFVQKNENRLAVPVSSINVEDKLVVEVGEFVPVDGEITSGRGKFDASNIIANSDELELKETQKVYAGLKLVSGSIEMKALTTSQNSVIHLLLKRLENLQTKTTPKQKKIAKKLDYMLYGLLIVASALLATQFMPSPPLSAIWLEKSLALLVISGSAFVLTSMQFSHLFSYLYAAKNGIYFYEPSIWQEMVKTKSLVLDKDGVITNDQPEVQEVISLARHSTQDILCMAASLAEASDNSRFEPLVKRAKSDDIILTNINSILDSSSKFVRADVSGNVLTLGSQSTIENMGLLTPEVNSKLSRWQGEGENVFLLADEKRVIGMITVLDPVRSEVGEFVDFCHYLGLQQVQLMSNDNVGTSEIIANRYGFDSVYSDLSERERQQCLENIAKQKSVLAVSSEAQASVDGIVFIHNNALNSGPKNEQNQIVSLGKNILLIPYMLQLSKKLDSRMNRLITLLINIKLLVLIAIFTNIISFGQVIIIEFLLATWVMSSTYRPKDMFTGNASAHS